MLLAASVLPSRGLLASGAREKGVVVRPLGGLPVSEPGVCCDTGLLCVSVDTASLTEFLRDWARRVCDRVLRCVAALSSQVWLEEPQPRNPRRWSCGWEAKNLKGAG